MSADYPLLSVIIPVYNGGTVLPRCLEALAASDLPRSCWELLVVDDGSTDGTDGIAARWADTVLRLPGPPHGPAYARNRGSEAARGDVLVFVDADVCVHRDTLTRIARVFSEDPELGALFGSYDDQPPAHGVASRYRNLLHHYHHQRNHGPADTFWAGCGAVRANAFHAVGRFDEWCYPRPSIEDIELGHRLFRAGHRIELVPTIQCRHLKHWRLYGILRTDLLDRGVPWVRLLLAEGSFSTRKSLNLRRRERVFTALVGLALLCLAVAAVRWEPTWLVGAALCVVPVLAGNFPLYRFLSRVGGVGFALACLPLHLVYYLLNGFAVLIGTLLHHLIGPPGPRPEVQAFFEVGMRRWPPVQSPIPRGSTPGGSGS